MMHSSAPPSISPWQRKLVFALATVSAVLAAPLGVHAAETAMAPAAEATQRHKVVFQISDADPKKWNLALNNVANVQKSLGKDQVAIEIVAYGPGIGMLRKESEVGDRVNSAMDQGVKIVACEATMHALDLGKDNMLSRIGYVPAGVVELMKRQSEGYAYIRP